MAGRGEAPDMTDTPAYRKRATLCAEIVPLMPLLGMHGGILFQALKSVADSVYMQTDFYFVEL